MTKKKSYNEKLQMIRHLLMSENASTQEEICMRLKSAGFAITQSTISRLLRRLGAIRTVTESGNVAYRLPETTENLVTSLADPTKRLILDVKSNGYLVIVHTTPGSASYVARHLDRLQPKTILGTIAGDDTIFVAPQNAQKTKHVLNAIQKILM